MKDSVIIVSGGMDSITLLYDKKDEIALGISFNYGTALQDSHIHIPYHYSAYHSKAFHK